MSMVEYEANAGSDRAAKRMLGILAVTDDFVADAILLFGEGEADGCCCLYFVQWCIV